MKQKEVSIKTPLEIWKEKNPDISEQEFNDLLNSVRQNFSAMPDRPARLEYLKNFCDWKRDEHKIAVYLSYFVYDAIDFYYKEKDPDKPEHYFLKNKPLSIIKSEINQRGALAVWDEYKGYIPLNIRNTRKHKLYSMNLLLEIYNNLYKPIIDTSPAADEEGNREKSFKILAKKIGWKPDTDIKPLIKIIQDNTDYLWNYDFIKSDKINLIGETEFQQITAILFFQNLLNEEFITHISRKKLNDLIMETFNFSFDVNNTNLSKTRNKINDGALAPKSKPIEERLTIKLAI